MGNSSNLIGKFEEISKFVSNLEDSIEYCEGKIREMREVQAEEEKEEQIDEVDVLEQKLKKLTNKRIQLQNRTQMIQEQLEGEENRAKMERKNVVDHEMYLQMTMKQITAIRTQMIHPTTFPLLQTYHYPKNNPSITFYDHRRIFPKAP